MASKLFMKLESYILTYLAIKNMNIDNLFQLEDKELDNLFSEINFDLKSTDWIDHDPEFIELINKSHAIDELVVLTYQSWLDAENKLQEKVAFKKAKQQQAFIREQLISYMHRALNKH